MLITTEHIGKKLDKNRVVYFEMLLEK